MKISETLQTPITDSCDVLVCGGGIAGIAAALAAARLGKRVTLLEKEHLLGGLGTAGLITYYLPLCLGVALSIGFAAVTYFNFVAEGFTLWVALSILAGLLFLIGTVFLLKDSMYKIKKINRNEFVLAEAKMRQLFEDTSTAEGPDLIGGSYVTYFCKACKDKTIKVKEHGTSAKNFSENTKAFAVFLLKNGNVEEKPFMLFLGKDYKIEEGITII